MSKVTLILYALMGAALIMLIAPNIFALNRGKMLRNIALWLAVFVGLALIYQNFGPGSEHPMFSLPPAMQRQYMAPAQTGKPSGQQPAEDKPPEKSL